MNASSRIHRIAAAILAVGALTLISGSAAYAATSDNGTDGPQFYTGLNVDVTGTIDGDVYASGQSVTISGDVTGDVIAAGQTIIVTGDVDGSVRLAAQDVTVAGTVSRSGTVFAATFTVAEGGAFGDDVVAASSAATINGEVGRDLVVSVGRLRIDGSVGGDLTYMSDSDASITRGAVDGSVNRVEPPETPRAEISPWAAVVAWLIGLVYALVTLSLVMLLAGLLAPRWLMRVTDHLVPSPWKALLVGFIASIAVPIALLFLLITIIGAPLALAGMLLWFLLTLAAFVFGAFYIGRLVLRGAQHPVARALLGGVILVVALQIPWLNIAVWLALVFVGTGAQLLEFYSQRPWRVSREADAARQPSEPTPDAPGGAGVAL